MTAANISPVEVLEGDSPIVLGLPHTGTYLPPEIMADLNARGQMLEDTDWHIHQLYDGLLKGATTVRATFHDDKGQLLGLVGVSRDGRQLLLRHDATTDRPGARLSNAIYPLHVAAVGGLGMKLALAFTGLLPTFLLVTGFLFWRRRTRR